MKDNMASRIEDYNKNFDPLKYSMVYLGRKYENKFSFYLANSINEILVNLPSHYVVTFKDFLFYDD